MKRGRFTAVQITGFLKGHEAGGRPPISRASTHGVSEATLYNWKAKYDGLDG